jgi:hypothetical protein
LNASTPKQDHPASALTNEPESGPSRPHDSADATRECAWHFCREILTTSDGRQCSASCGPSNGQQPASLSAPRANGASLMSGQPHDVRYSGYDSMDLYYKQFPPPRLTPSDFELSNDKQRPSPPANPTAALGLPSSVEPKLNLQDESQPNELHEHHVPETSAKEKMKKASSLWSARDGGGGHKERDREGEEDNDEERKLKHANQPGEVRSAFNSLTTNHKCSLLLQGLPLNFSDSVILSLSEDLIPLLEGEYVASLEGLEQGLDNDVSL